LKIAILLWLITLYAQIHGVDPELAKAVAIVESRKPGGAILRTGRLGKSRYFGPMGIDQRFLSRWPIDNPVWNIWAGTRALAIHLRRTGSVRAALKRYNPKADPAYYRAVMGAMK